MHDVYIMQSDSFYIVVSVKCVAYVFLCSFKQCCYQKLQFHKVVKLKSHIISKNKILSGIFTGFYIFHNLNKILIFHYTLTA